MQPNDPAWSKVVFFNYYYYHYQSTCRCPVLLTVSNIEVKLGSVPFPSYLMSLSCMEANFHQGKKGDRNRKH